MAKFTFTTCDIEGLFTVDPTVFGDDRGYFMETFNDAAFRAAGYTLDFVQDNQSKSKKGVLRGLHMQVNNPQGKLVRVIRGEVFDVAVDMRRGSPTLGRWHGVLLSEQNNRQFFVPEGFAHGFLVISDEAEFVYKCTRLYDASDELGIIYNDADIGVEWPLNTIGAPTLSEKDENLPSFKEALNILGY